MNRTITLDKHETVIDRYDLECIEERITLFETGIKDILENNKGPLQGALIRNKLKQLIKD